MATLTARVLLLPLALGGILLSPPPPAASQGYWTPTSLTGKPRVRAPATLASSLNFTAGQTRANNAIVSLAADGSGTIKVKNGSAGTVHFVLDVNGYFQ